MCWVHIIGGGVSGLSLALALTDHGVLPGDVIISDPRMFDQRSQTFCFWFTEDERSFLQPERAWSSWSFSTHTHHPQPHQAHTHPHQAHTHQGSRYLYGVVSGEGFRQRALERLQAHPQVHLSESLITSPPSARHIFDSRPPQREDFWVHQSFVGFELNTTHAYPLERVSLMEEMSEGFGGMLFKYVLPFSANRVLIEYTVFTQAHIDLDELHRYGLKALEREGLEGYEVSFIRPRLVRLGLSLNRTLVGDAGGGLVVSALLAQVCGWSVFGAGARCSDVARVPRLVAEPRPVLSEGSCGSETPPDAEKAVHTREPMVSPVRVGQRLGIFVA